MANLASSAVTVRRAFEEGDRTGKRVGVTKEVTVVLTGQGTTTNTIPASAFGFTYIYESSPWVKDDNTLVHRAHPSYDNTLLLLTVAAAVDTPADVTGTFRAIVKGY